MSVICFPSENVICRAAVYLLPPCVIYWPAANVICSSATNVTDGYPFGAVMKNREASMLRDFFNHLKYALRSIRRRANLLRPPVAEISQEVRSIERKLAPQCGATTIEIAEQATTAVCSV